MQAVKIADIFRSDVEFSGNGSGCPDWSLASSQEDDRMCENIETSILAIFEAIGRIRATPDGSEVLDFMGAQIGIESLADGASGAVIITTANHGMVLQTGGEREFIGSVC